MKYFEISTNVPLKAYQTLKNPDPHHLIVTVKLPEDYPTVTFINK